MNNDEPLLTTIRHTLDRAANDLTVEQASQLRHLRSQALQAPHRWTPGFIWFSGSALASVAAFGIFFLLQPPALHPDRLPVPPQADISMLQDMPMLEAIGEDHAS